MRELTDQTSLTGGKTYWLETYGCQMNKAESEALEIRLRDAGFLAGPHAAAADLVVLNTCSVRETAEERIWGRLGYFRNLKSKKNFILAVMGCMSERLKDELKAKYPEIDVVVGTFQKTNFMDKLTGAFEKREPTPGVTADEYRFASLHWNGGFKAFVPIMHGCDNYCSYCIVPYVRGPEISRSPDDVLAELRLLSERGVKEVTLLGQNVNSYHFQSRGRRVDFPELLRRAVEETTAIKWMRFLTSHPKDFTPALADRLASSSVYCRHIHLPVQHGSDRVLTLMNRGYTAEQYLSLLRMIKNTISGATITTDILIGFPTEGEDDLRRTLDLMEEAEFDDAYTYYYNPRRGTKAQALGDTVPREEKLRRLRRVIDLNLELKRRSKARRLGGRTVVLVEGFSKKAHGELLGRTEHDEMVVFPGAPERIGEFAAVRIIGISGTTFRGSPVD